MLTMNVTYTNITKLSKALFFTTHIRQYSTGKGNGILDKVLIRFGFKEPPGKLIGKDSMGNRYYEREPWSRSRDPKIKRWVEREEGVNQWEQNFLEELNIPVEWRTWLHFKRNSPPSEEEINRNNAMIMRTKHRAEELQEKERLELGITKEEADKAESKQELLEFPVYPEFQSKPQTKRRDEK